MAALEKTKQDKATLVAMEKQLAAKESELKKKLESYRYGNTPAGRFAWPTNGMLTSGFGSRPNSSTRCFKDAYGNRYRG